MQNSALPSKPASSSYADAACSADGVLGRISSAADELKLANLRPQIDACRNLLHAHDGIDVVVFGRFKAGKSSLLNHLAGRDVLPIGVVPLTAVITRLQYGPTERAEVRYLDGTKRLVSIGDIRLYVGEHDNPHNAKGVAEVDVDLPSLQPLAPLRLVDTPGLGSAFAHNTAVALEWLPNVGAALVAISSDAPLSERDLALLADLRRHTPQIVVVLTKADLLSAAQRDEVSTFIHAELRSQGNAALRVYFYSVLPAYSEFKTQLEQDVLLPLVLHRGEMAEQILQHKLTALTAQTLNYARIALAAATQAESTRQELRDRLADEHRQLQLLREEFRVLTRLWAANALVESLTKLQPTQHALQKRATEELRAQFSQWRVSLPEFLRRWRESLETFLARELIETSRIEAPVFRAPLERTRDHLERTLRAFNDRLAGHVHDALGITLTPRQVALEVNEPPAPPIDVAFGFDSAFTIIAHVLPLAPLRPLVERSLLQKSRYEVEKNISRLAAAWCDRVAKEIEVLARQAEQHALDELTTLEQMLERTTSSEARMREVLAMLST